MTSTHEGSGGQGYGRTQQKARPTDDTLSSYLKAQDHPTHACPVRIGGVAANVQRVTAPMTCPHVATRDPRAKAAQGCRGPVRPSSWSIANPTSMRELARVGTSRATLEHPHPTTHSLLLERLVPTYARPLMWPSCHTLRLMLQTWGARGGRGRPRVMRPGVQWGAA